MPPRHVVFEVTFCPAFEKLAVVLRRGGAYSGEVTLAGPRRPVSRIAHTSTSPRSRSTYIRCKFGSDGGERAVWTLATHMAQSPRFVALTNPRPSRVVLAGLLGACLPQARRAIQVEWVRVLLGPFITGAAGRSVRGGGTLCVRRSNKDTVHGWRLQPRRVLDVFPPFFWMQQDATGSRPVGARRTWDQAHLSFHCRGARE